MKKPDTKSSIAQIIAALDRATATGLCDPNSGKITITLELNPMKIVLFKSKKNRQTYFKIVASNGQIIAQSEGYKKHASAEKTADRLIRDLARAKVIGRAPKKPKKIVETAEDDSWRHDD